jgi:asparaginyl-tRNA synthetase
MNKQIEQSDKHISVRNILESNELSKELVTIKGWVRTHRQSKNVSFIELNDGSIVSSLQIVIDPELEEYKDIASKITTGTSLIIRGELQSSKGGKQSVELMAKKIILVGESDPETYPLQKKGHTLEFLREILHLRSRSNTIGAVMRVRSKLSYNIHKFYQERGFHYIHAPIITTSDCEGAGEMFRVTSLNFESQTKAILEPEQDFFGERSFLTVSGQLQAEVYATALSLVYTFGPTFRAENSNTPRHLAEFWMIEPEMAFYDLNDTMQLAEDFIKYLLKATISECRSDLTFLHGREWSNPNNLELLEKLSESHFETLEYTEAIEVLKKSGKSFEFPVSWGIDLQTEHERYLTDEYVKGPLFVINYPKAIKAFYMKVNDDNRTVKAMDVLVPRLGEIIGGSQREDNATVLEQRMKECHIPLVHNQWYLDLRRYGTVPHSGFGLGLERLLMYLTGVTNIRDAIPFPRFPGHAKG